MFMGRRLRRLVLASEKGRAQHGCGQKMGVVSKKKNRRKWSEKWMSRALLREKKKRLAAAPERRLGGSTHPKKKKIGSTKREKGLAEHDWEHE